MFEMTLGKLIVIVLHACACVHCALLCVCMCVCVPLVVFVFIVCGYSWPASSESLFLSLVLLSANIIVNEFTF